MSRNNLNKEVYEDLLMQYLWEERLIEIRSTEYWKARTIKCLICSAKLGTFNDINPHFRSRHYEIIAAYYFEKEARGGI
jgi:hypothetical protein